MSHPQRWVHLLALALVVSVVAIVPAAAGAAPFVVSATSDSSPGIDIDAAGTAHIAWGTRTGAAFPYNYSVTYCKIPRGGTACTGTVNLPNPGNLNSFGSTQVLVKGSQVVILQSMCCGPGSGTIMRKSSDGGATFPPPWFKVLTEPAGFSLFRSAQNQAGTGAMVNDSGGTRAGFVAFDGSQFAASPPQHGGGEILGAADVGWLNATTPFMTQMGYLTDHLYTRFFNSAATGYNIGGNWLAATQIDTKLNQSAIATGPSGAFVAAGTTVGHPFGNNELAVYRINDAGVAGPPAPIIQETTPAHSPTNIDLAQDAGGRLHAVWTDAGFDGKMYYEWSNDGATWSPPTLIQLDPSAGGYDNRLAVAGDGGGWVLTDSNGSGPIVAAPIEPKGSSSPPPRVKPPGPAPPGPPTPPSAACPAQIKVTTDAPAVVRSGGCFTGKAPTYKTTGAIRVGGVDLVPQGSGTLTVDTSSGTIVSSGSTKYEVRAGSTVLARSTIKWDLTKPISISGVSAFGVKLFGLGVTGKADLWFTKGEGRVQINLDLPSPLDAVNANTVLRTTMSDGLIIDGFAVNGHDIPIGPITMTKFNIAYSSGADALEGSFSMKLPPGASDNVSGGLGLADGSFKHAELEIGPGVPPLPLPLWATPPVTLSRIGASASNTAEGFKMAGKVGIVGGGEIAGTALVGVDGTLELFVPSSRAYAQIRAQGDVKVVGIPLGGGFVQIRSDGPLTFGGALGIDFDIVKASFKTAGGINLANGDFYASGEAEIGVNLLVIKGELKASSIISTVGVAACGEIKGTIPKTGLSGSVSLGYQKAWGKDSELGGCEIDKYIPASLKGRAVLAGGFGPSEFDPLARAAQTPAGQITLKEGALAGVKVRGTGGRPGFTFAGPNGRTITVPPNITEPIIEASIAAVPVGPESVELQVKQPKGNWTVTPDGAAPTVAQVLSAGALPIPKVTGTVRRGGGAKRVLSVTTSNLGNQTLMLRELLPGGAASEIGRVTANGSKRLTFTPATAAGGRRTIEAVILNGAKVAGTRQVASYTAPRPGRLAGPRRVTVTRKRAGRAAVNVRWTKVTGAASYRVLVSGTDGRKEYFTTKRSATKLAIPNVTYDDKLKIAVQAIPKLGAPGTARTATSKAVKLKKKKKKK